MKIASLPRPAPAGLPPSRCPDCAAPLTVQHHGDDDGMRCGCAGLVGTTFSDPHGGRLPLRAVYSPVGERPCAACGGARRRILVGEVVGVACDGCGVIVRRPRAVEGADDRRFSRRGLLLEALGVVAVVAAIAALFVWWSRLRAG